MVAHQEELEYVLLVALAILMLGVTCEIRIFWIRRRRRARLAERAKAEKRLPPADFSEEMKMAEMEDGEALA